MKKIIFVITIICFGLTAIAQVDSIETITDIEATMNPEPPVEKIHSFCEVMPAFPGGDSALRKCIDSIITYPPIAIESGAEGKVIVSFVVEKDGSVSQIRIMSKKIGMGLEEEAIRVVKLLPKFIPGSENGVTVRVLMYVPVVFSILK